MIVLIFYLACVFVAIGTGVLAGWSDFKGMTIPNSYSVIVAAVFVFAFGLLWLTGHDRIFFSFTSHLLGALIVFVITMLMFAAKGIGAADSKLGTAYALWVGLGGLPVYLFYMTLFGGLLGLSALALKKWKPFKNPPKDSWIDQVQGGASKVPYGVAIVFGALVSFFNLGYFNIETLRFFFPS